MPGLTPVYSTLAVASVGTNDLLLIAKFADLAHTRVCELSGKDNGGEDNGTAA